MNTNKKVNLNAHVQDYLDSLIHPVYKFILPTYTEQVEHVSKFPTYNKIPEKAKDIYSVFGKWYEVKFMLPNKPVETVVGKIFHINPIGDNVYYSIDCGKVNRVFTRKQIQSGVVTIKTAKAPKHKQFTNEDLDKVNFIATEVLQFDKKPNPVTAEHVHISFTTKEVQDRYWAAINGRAILAYTDEMQYLDVPKPFNKLVIQHYKLSNLQYDTDKFTKWAIMNMAETTFQVKFIAETLREYKSKKDPSINKDIIIKVDREFTIAKGDFDTYNAVIAEFKELIQAEKDNRTIQDNLSQISKLYTPEILQLLNIKDKNYVLSSKFETRVIDAIKKYGRDYGIDLPTRTEYDSEYHAFKKDMISSKGNNTFKYSFTVYEDPADQKDFIDNSRVMTLPRSKAVLLAQSEELVELHTRFVTMMYLVKATLDIVKDTEADPFIVESKAEAKALALEAERQNYKHFCESNGISYDPNNLYVDLEDIEVATESAYIQ